MSGEPVTVPLGGAVTITRQSYGGWTANFMYQNAPKIAAFSDSVDLSMWLNDVLVISDGGKRQSTLDHGASARSEVASVS